MILYLILIFVLIAMDRALKIFLPSLLAGGETVTLIPNVIQLRYVENTGAAFGIFQNSTIILAILTGIVLLFLIYYLLFKSGNSKLLRLSLSLIVAGGLGNLFDRVVSGYVVDYLDLLFMDFAVFNLADCLINIGAVLFLVYFIFIDGKKKTDEAGIDGEELDDDEREPGEKELPEGE